MIGLPSLEDTMGNIICDEDCDKCDKNQECEYRELKLLLDNIPEYIGV